MKKILLSVFLISIVFSSPAQIVLNLGDVAPIGTNYALGVDTIPGPSIVAGGSGTGQAWNLSAVNAAYIDSVKIVSPASTPYSASFAASTFCSERFSFGDTSFFYIDANSTDMKMVGIVLDPLQTGNKFKIATNPPSKIMTFPYQMGSAYMDTSYGEVSGSGSEIGQAAIDSFRYKSLSMRNVMVDGEGTLTLVNGTYSVLREKEISRSLDSIFVKFPFVGWQLFQDTDVTDSTYRWISDSLGLNIAELGFDTLGNENQFQYIDPDPVMVSLFRNPGQALAFYPNPANEEFCIENNSGENAALIIRNVAGQTLNEVQLSSGKNRIETNNLNAGVYFLEMRNKASKNRVTGKLVIQK